MIIELILIDMSEFVAAIAVTTYIFGDCFRLSWDWILLINNFSLFYSFRWLVLSIYFLDMPPLNEILKFLLVNCINSVQTILHDCPSFVIFLLQKLLVGFRPELALVHCLPDILLVLQVGILVTHQVEDFVLKYFFKCFKFLILRAS